MSDKNLDKRLAKLEESRLQAEFLRVEQMTDAELSAFLAEDPKSEAVLETLTKDELEAIVRGEPAAMAIYNARLNAL